MALLSLSTLLFAWGLYLAGPAAAFTVAVALAAAAALYVLARARLLRQRNGNFLAAAVVLLLAVSLVLVQQLFLFAVSKRDAPVVTQSTPIPAAMAPATPMPVKLAALIEQFPPARESLVSGPIGAILRPTKVEYAGKRWLLRPGDVFPIAGATETEVRLAVDSDEVTVPAAAIRLKPSADETAKGESAQEKPPTLADAAGAAQHAREEAVRRYPALGVQGSPENESFIAAWRELKYGGENSFFDDADWPIRLAEMLANREGWTDAQGVRHEPKLSPAGQEAQQIEVRPPDSSVPAAEEPAVKNGDLFDTSPVESPREATEP